MKVWTNTKFEGLWPVGVAAVVVADTAGQAAELLNAALQSHWLPQSAEAEQFELLITTKPGAVILCDGDY